MSHLPKCIHTIAHTIYLTINLKTEQKKKQPRTHDIHKQLCCLLHHATLHKSIYSFILYMIHLHTNTFDSTLCTPHLHYCFHFFFLQIQYNKCYKQFIEVQCSGIFQNPRRLNEIFHFNLLIYILDSSCNCMSGIYQ